jgi:hypothetical protein
VAEEYVALKVLMVYVAYMEPPHTFVDPKMVAASLVTREIVKSDSEKWVGVLYHISRPGPWKHLGVLSPGAVHCTKAGNPSATRCCFILTLQQEREILPLQTA